ncbi:hypothetical protein FA13DRAFT_1639196 [Coprinellus micaceus]|uniref:Uncharacterized protein n=1 Tax=Coprinellus micaceus TaxID=71717 RepID=A0A4Y7SRU6_COPMI|nr:hypothetical protein FA13DRAFT_1649412 [Coprinellus micaceus]TEB23989.1 hypothetical protein FA13DRAFT_1639196 [Coprinellus micaceus]
MGNSLGRRTRSDFEGDNNLTLGPRKRPARTDPLVSHGRHFGRTIHAFCRPFALIKEGISRHLQMETGVFTASDLTENEIREHNIFKNLLKLSTGLDQRVMRASEQELHYIADMIQKGAACARSDDTKGLKSAIIDWITPKDGTLSPPLSRNIKDNRGWFHYRTGQLLCPPTLDWTDADVRKCLRSGEIVVSGDQWPAFLYENEKINLENPWDGLLQGALLVSAFKYIFTSPSSVESQDTRATRAGNADLHGMKAVTTASLAYVSTLVRFSLTSSAVFSRNDKTTDSERFYGSVLGFLELPSETSEVEALLRWWNRQVPSYIRHGPRFLNSL